MAWKVKTKMEQKVEFICEWRTQKYSISELCRAFNISRPTAYKLIHRYQSYGIEGLEIADRPYQSKIPAWFKKKMKSGQNGHQNMDFILFTPITTMRPDLNEAYFKL